jgi:hypothetical protein
MILLIGSSFRRYSSLRSSADVVTSGEGWRPEDRAKDFNRVERLDSRSGQASVSGCRSARGWSKRWAATYGSRRLPAGRPVPDPVPPAEAIDAG